MPTTSRVLLLALILLATGLRLPPLFSNHFHADEALFASWARLIAVWRDPLLITQVVDKPPLLFYLQALAFPAFGRVEWAARIPNMIASILLVPLTAVFSWRTVRNSLGALIAALLVAMSPLAIQFSATAFTDPLMTGLLVAALLFVVSPSRPSWAGICFGLAILTKHQAWLFLPLLAGFAWLSNWRIRQWQNMLAGLLPPFLILLVWQLLRRGSLDIWSNQLGNFGGLRLAWSWELLPRLSAWSTLWPYTLGSIILLLLFLPLLPVVWRSEADEDDTSILDDRLLVIYIIVYLTTHWLLAIPVWDRYLLPLIPLVAVVIGHGLGLINDRVQKKRSDSRYSMALLGVLLLLLLTALQAPAAFAARRSQFSVGSQPGADQGAWQVAEYLDQAPYGTVLYDHWYSWHWRYAFLDRGVYISWFAHPDDLARDLEVFGSAPGQRFLVLPDSEVALPVLRRLEATGFVPNPVLRTGARPGMILYQLKHSGR